MQNLYDGLDAIVGGVIYKNKPTIYVLCQGDTLALPNYTISYPDIGGPSNLYTLNGKRVRCKPAKDDNIWNTPSPISNSQHPRDRLIVHTDGHYLYIEDHQLNAYQ